MKDLTRCLGFVISVRIRFVYYIEALYLERLDLMLVLVMMLIALFPKWSPYSDLVVLPNEGIIPRVKMIVFAVNLPLGKDTTGGDPSSIIAFANYSGNRKAPHGHIPLIA